MKKIKLTVFFVSFLFLVFACAQETDRKGFKVLEQDARFVHDTVVGGADYQQLGPLVKKFSAGVSQLKGRVKSGDRELMNAFSALAGFYEDGLLLMKYQREFIRFGIVPKGRIYVGQDVEPLVEKYRFITEAHLYKPTQQYWKSIPEEAIKVVWANADSQFAIIQALLKE